MQIIHAVGQLIACQEPAHCLSAISRKLKELQTPQAHAGPPAPVAGLQVSRSFLYLGGGALTPPQWRQVREGGR